MMQNRLRLSLVRPTVKSMATLAVFPPLLCRRTDGEAGEQEAARLSCPGQTGGPGPWVQRTGVTLWAPMGCCAVICFLLGILAPPICCPAVTRLRQVLPLGTRLYLGSRSSVTSSPRFVLSPPMEVVLHTEAPGASSIHLPGGELTWHTGLCGLGPLSLKRQEPNPDWPQPR